MRSNQERLYVASQIVDRVAVCLIDLSDGGLVAEYHDLRELVGRLDVAVEVIRQVNGAAQ